MPCLGPVVRVSIIAVLFPKMLVFVSERIQRFETNPIVDSRSVAGCARADDVRADDGSGRFHHAPAGTTSLSRKYHSNIPRAAA